MSNRVYVLQVGINAYPPGVPVLSGCLNDVAHLGGWLSHQFSPAAMAVETLKDTQATRANVIDAFRKHLGQAREGDVALFHFCGHGARWASNPAFRPFYPDGKDEGLVCIDSRLPGGFDLADKELAVLIAELAQHQAHVAVVLDCCHSGSGTRGIDAFRGLKPRLADDVPTERPLESYLGGHYTKLLESKQSLYIPTARHVALAACERGQLAQETADNAGVFTSTLVEVLEKTGGELSYAELFVRCRAAVRSRADDQNPQFETYDCFDAHSGFLGRSVARTGKRYAAGFDKGAWTVECGALHGLPTELDQSAALALYAEGAGTQPAGTATVVQVGAQRSVLKLDFASAESAQYRAEVISLPVAPLPINFIGDAALIPTLQKALDEDGSVRVSLVGAAAGAQHALEAQAGQLSLTRVGAGDAAPVLIATAKVGPGTPVLQALSDLLPSLKSVLSWERSRNLRNPRTQLDTAQIELQLAEVLEDGSEHVYPGHEVTLDITKAGAEWRHARLRFKVRNRTPQTLHMALAYYSADYGVYVQANEPLEPGESWMSLWGDAPNQFLYLEEGVDETIEHFKLLVSTEKVDDFLLVQEPIVMGQEVGGTRGVGSVKPPRKVVHQNEWLTHDCRVRVVRRLDQVAAADVKVAQGRITVKGHPSVTADISLGAARTSTRSTSGAVDFYKAFEQRGMPLLNFAGTRGGDDQSILELTDIRHAETLKEHPLEVVVNLPLAENEAILPLVYDGQHVYLGGMPSRQDDGSTLITIDSLPPAADQRRSLGGALKLYFFKTVLKRESVNLLRWVDFRPDGSLQQVSDGVGQKVAAAKRVLLLVHGIIGDTESIAAGVRGFGLHEKFDLVLTYDYENLSTPIPETARLLKQQLAEVGLHDTDDKHLTMLVHSMGGLVSRWFIEQEGGHQLVDHLVMCGTPNNGSPFGKVDEARTVLSMLTGLAMNYLPAFIPMTGAVMLVLNRSKKLTPTLEQMNPSSEFIRTLNASPDPGLPYTIIAGDVNAYHEPSDALFAKLLTKAGQSVAFDRLFSNRPNDIAVGVDSILSVGAGGARLKPPVQHNVACHHMNYFISETGRAALKLVAW